MQISEEEIKRNCSSAIYRRGLEYYQEGRVHLRLREEDAIGAIVDGEELYNVRITFSADGHIHDMLCTCPYYQTMGVACKHIVATLKMRQAELLEQSGDGAQNENDRLAAGLCSEYEKLSRREQCHLGLTLRISRTTDGSCTYSAVIRLGTKYLEPIKGVESFLEAYIQKKEFKISRHHSIDPHLFIFPPAEQEVLQILAESYENKSSQALYYTPRLTETTFGAYTAKRLFPLIGQFDCELVIDGIQLSDAVILEEDPDITVDVTATDENISLTVTESGSALLPDGEWFFCDGQIYRTSEKWRSWFMPIYHAVIEKQRTEIDFSKNHRLEFAEKILPMLKNRRGVVLQGVEEVIIDENAAFDLYLDCKDRRITAVVIAHYGSVSLRLPYEQSYSGKILIRQYEKEENILRHFRDFSLSENTYSLEGNAAIYRFFREDLPELSKLAAVVMSNAFTEMLRERTPKIQARVEYDEKIDLLKVDFDTDLTPEELSSLLSALREEHKFYRFQDGSFIDLEKNHPLLSMLGQMEFSPDELKKQEKTFSKRYMLYLMSLTGQGQLQAEEAFLRLEESVKNLHATLPEHLNTLLRGYQKDGVDWMTQLSALDMGGILADDMGLGKTLQVIAFVMSEKPEKPALVVAPSALTYNWLQEIERFAPEARAKIIDGTREEREHSLENTDGFHFLITSYALLRRDIDLYQKKHFSDCFLDEAQYIKNPRTMNAIAAKKLRSDRRFALTGTPIENTVSELWSIFDFVMPGYLSTHQSFLEKYERPLLRDGGSPAGEDLKNRVHPFILRRMKADVLSELPEKIENNVYAPLEPEQQKMYSAYLAAARKEADAYLSGGENTIRILSLLLRLRQICCHPKLIDEDYQKGSGKLLLLEELLSSAKDAGHRALVFSQFTSMLAIIGERLRQSGISYFYLDGATPSAQRIELADRFNGGEGDVFLISLKAGGTGLNLTGADMVIHYDPWWNPAVTDQASDRAHRIGQTKAVQIIKLATKGTIEEQILKLSEKKRNLADRIIEENTSLISSLSREELRKLFE